MDGGTAYVYVGMGYSLDPSEGHSGQLEYTFVTDMYPYDCAHLNFNHLEDLPGINICGRDEVCSISITISQTRKASLKETTVRANMTLKLFLHNILKMGIKTNRFFTLISKLLRKVRKIS